MQQAAIGIFDSGVGGLSVLADLKDILPNENFEYLADTAHVPYGERPEHEIKQLTAQGVAALCDMGVKAVVVACNTASSYSLTHLRETFQQPIIGLVPAIKPAAQASVSKVVGLLATPGTLRGTLLQDVIDEFAAPFGVKVIQAAHRELVPLIEAGKANSDETHELLRDILRPFADAGADQLVLGCTHFPFLTDSIREVYGDIFELIDSGEGVARHTKHILASRDLLRPTTASADTTAAATTRYWVTGAAAESQAVFSQLTGKPDCRVRHLACGVQSA